MYGMVLAMALSGAGEAPDCHFLSMLCGCHGGGGCYGGACYGGGCYGGGCYGGGCDGGGYGGGCDGGWGGGCHGGGGGACHGGCRGGCCGGGCYGGGCYGGGVIYGAPVVMPPGGTPDKVPAPDKKDGDKKPPEQGRLISPAPATVIVSLPADATLTVDNYATRSTSATRTFVSPALQPGKDFNYTLKAEIVRDGQTLTAMQTVKVRAGEETRVSFDSASFAASLASK